MLLGCGMGLVTGRHPNLDRLVALWRARQQGAALPPARALGREALAELASLTVLIADAPGSDGAMVIADSGAAVDALYGAPLTGAPARELGAPRSDADREARTAIETARPLLVEEDLARGGERRRIARLYLPLAKDDGSPDGVLCGVVALT